MRLQARRGQGGTGKSKAGAGASDGAAVALISWTAGLPDHQAWSVEHWCTGTLVGSRRAVGVVGVVGVGVGVGGIGRASARARATPRSGGGGLAQ
jgi:hypothetical protein